VGNTHETQHSHQLNCHHDHVHIRNLDIIRVSLLGVVSCLAFSSRDSNLDFRKRQYVCVSLEEKSYYLRLENLMNERDFILILSLEQSPCYRRGNFISNHIHRFLDREICIVLS